MSPTPPTTVAAPPSSRDRMATQILAALGIVYGDIGTSPLYTIRECFNPVHGIEPIEANVLGVLSLVFWALILIVTIKYVLFVMRADNRGEGGVMALMALALRGANRRKRRVIIVLGLCGASLFYGDGIITPAISVLSAVEGLEVATPLFKPYVIPLTLAVLVALFLLQRRGADRVGSWFGPIMAVWFFTLALLGVVQIADNPGVLRAVDPRHAAALVGQLGWLTLFVLGAAFLAVTGAEALYADMGQLGKRPIRLAWVGFVLPALLLNYFGQGALVLADASAVRNPFYLLAPAWGLYPLVVLSTLATVIASQAMITGAFSVTRQAIQLGFSPRLVVRHTSDEAIGQVYMPQVNAAMLVAVVLLVLGFGSSSNLAAAYGIAVSGTMLVTTFLLYVVARRRWGWSVAPSVALVGCFLAIDLTFFIANAVKIPDGGWFPLVTGAAIFTVLATWQKGRSLQFERMRDSALSLQDFLNSSSVQRMARVPGTAIFMTSNIDAVPHPMLHNLKHNKVLHERVVLLTVQIEDVPYVADADRLEVRGLGHEFYAVIARYGFQQTPDIPQVLTACDARSLHFDMMQTSFFLGRETLIAGPRRDMARWRRKLFIWLSRNGARAPDFFRIPPNRVVEMGAQIEL